MNGEIVETTEIVKPVMKVGDKFQITGGKYKKFGSAVLMTKNATYSDCELPEDKCKELEQINRIVKIKNDYLLPINPIVVEMPEAEDLHVVNNLEEWEQQKLDDVKEISDKMNNIEETIEPKTDKQLVEEILKTCTQEEQDEVGGVLEVNDNELCDNITEQLPSVDEALALRKEVVALRNDVKILQQELNLKCRELQLALEERVLDKKKWDYVRHVLNLV